MGNKSETRNKIILAAIRLFNTQGYNATSISDITKATGLTKGAIYSHFTNKDDLAVQSFDYAAAIILEAIRQRISHAPDAPLKLKAIVNYYEEYVLNPPIAGGCPAINTAIEADDNFPMLRSKVIRFIALMKESLQKIIYRGIQMEQLDSNIDVEETALLLYTSINGAIMISRIEGDIETYKIIKQGLEKKIDLITTPKYQLVHGK